MAIQTTTFKGARYLVKFHDPIEWADTESYEAIEAVQHNAFTYISKQPVPAGVQIDNTDFWLLWADPNAQMEELRQLVSSYVDDVQAIDTLVDAINDALPIADFDSANTVKDEFAKTNKNVTLLQDNETEYAIDDKTLAISNGKQSSYQSIGFANKAISALMSEANYAIYPIIQGATYNSRLNRMVLAFRDSSSINCILVECSLNMSTVYKTSNALPIGHANSLAYNPTDDCILVACGDTGTYASCVAVVDADTFEVTDHIEFDFSPWAIDYDVKNNVIYVSNYISLTILDAQYNVLKTASIPNFMNYISCTGQGGVCINGRFYIIYSTSDAIMYMVSYNLETLQIEYFYSFVLPYRYWEAEDAFTVGNKLYHIGGQLYVFEAIYSLDSLSNENVSNYTVIPNNSDLNDYVVPGSYIVPTASGANSLSNYPRDLLVTNYAGTVYVVQQGADHIRQFVLANNNKIATRTSSSVRQEQTVTWTDWNLIANHDPFEKGVILNNGTDLNDVVTPGKYFVADGAHAQTILNYPTGLGAAGFSMYVYINGADHLRQTFIGNGGSKYERRGDTLTNPTWSEWTEI